VDGALGEVEDVGFARREEDRMERRDMVTLREGAAARRSSTGFAGPTHRRVVW